MKQRSQERARFLRADGLPGVEALHATFIRHRYAPHVHDTWTVAHVISGAASFELEGRRHTAPAGMAFVIPPGAVHTGEPATIGGYTYRVLYLDPQALAGWCEIAPRPPARRTPVVVQAPELTRALSGIHVMLPLAGRGLEQGEALTNVFHALLELLPSAEPAQRTPARVHPGVRRARIYIHEHFREDFSLAELARVSGLSMFHLARSFRDQIGAPPSAYRRALRVQAAQRLLRAGTPPAATALDCGFYDQAHLNRHFKRITGVTPAQYASAAK